MTAQELEIDKVLGAAERAVAGGAGFAVKGDGVSADDEKSSARVG
jgi:hypothetical protein